MLLLLELRSSNIFHPSFSEQLRSKMKRLTKFNFDPFSGFVKTGMSESVSVLLDY